MIKIKVNEKNIEKALKEYKLKFKRIKVKEELINRKNFTKPSEEEREPLLGRVNGDNKRG